MIRRGPALPGPLPAGENVLWQGGPSVAALARRPFHLRAIGGYFALLAAVRAGAMLYAGGSLGAAALSALWFAALAVAAAAILALLAYATARATIYTVTDHRVVLAIGAALPMHISIPLDQIDAAGLRQGADGSGDIALTLAAPAPGPSEPFNPAGGRRLSWVVLWPHVVAFRLRGRGVEPLLRGLADAPRAAQVLSRALAAGAATAVPAIAPAGEASPHAAGPRAAAAA